MQPDKDSELLGVGNVTVEKEDSLESFLVKRVSQIPEIESLYKYEDGRDTVFFTILGAARYQRDVNMKVYEIEYAALRAFPDTNIAFRCIPRLGMVDDHFLPMGAVRLYNRVEKS